MRVLVVGSGGRESAFVWAAAQDPNNHVFVSPGNPGMKRYAICVLMDDYQVADYVALAQKLKIDLVIPGSEDLLCEGLADELQKVGILTFGPIMGAAKLEGSKIYAKDLMSGIGVPTAAYKVFDEVATAFEFIQSHFQDFPDQPLVIKADGLARGKGVTIAATRDQALESIEQLMINQVLKEAGMRIVVEEFLEGEEISFFVLVGTNQVVAFGTARDYKKERDDDQGENTGGLGCYSPIHFVSPQVTQHIMETIIEPVLEEQRSRGQPFIGFLYAGLIYTNEGFMVLEFNARMGDPEAQVVLPRLRSNLVEVITKLLSGEQVGELEWREESAVCVVLASFGYPDSKKYQTGFPISGLAEAEKLGCLVFQSGTKEKNGILVTNGGRVLSVVALGTPNEARDLAYQGARRINFGNKYNRTDIAAKVL